MERFYARFRIVRAAVMWWRRLLCRILHHRPEHMTFSFQFQAGQPDPAEPRLKMQVQRCLRCDKVLNEFLVELRNEWASGNERVIVTPVHKVR